MYPEEYCSVIVDGAAQSAFALLHFITKIKCEKGHSKKVRPICAEGGDGDSCRSGVTGLTKLATSATTATAVMKKMKCEAETAPVK